MTWRGLPKPQPLSPAAAAPDGAVAGLCVLASGSSGNASVLVVRGDKGWVRGGGSRVILIDAGLSPGITRKRLAERGIGLDDIDDVVLTHLDRDHFHGGWRRVRDFKRATLRLHRRHLNRAERDGALLGRNEPLAKDESTPTMLGDRVALHHTLLDHDQLGVAAFRFALNGATLGFATDLGRVTPKLESLVNRVDVLAIESNYCPEMQAASDRPDFLKRRITGGAGHLSNQECAHAVERVQPREHAVFLHLSRQCNHPDLVAEMHQGADYDRTISTQDKPTRWIWLTPSPENAADAAIRTRTLRMRSGLTIGDTLSLFAGNT